MKSKTYQLPAGTYEVVIGVVKNGIESLSQKASAKVEQETTTPAPTTKPLPTTKPVATTPEEIAPTKEVPTQVTTDAQQTTTAISNQNVAQNTTNSAANTVSQKKNGKISYGSWSKVKASKKIK